MHKLVQIGVVVAVGVAMLGACGDDDDVAADAPKDLAAWCDLIEDVDAQFNATDNSSDDLDVKQAEYAAIAADVERLRAGLDLVDADHRDDVEAALEFAQRLTDAFVDAEDQGEVETAMEEVFNDPDSEAAVKDAAPWIRDECGVSID